MRVTSSVTAFSVGVVSQPLRSAHSAIVSGTECSGGGFVPAAVVVVESTSLRGEPSGAGNDATAGPSPPSYGRNGSAVPWIATTGTAREGLHVSKCHTPAMGATAAMRSASDEHAIADVVIAPLERPVTKTRAVSTHTVCSMSSIVDE